MGQGMREGEQSFHASPGTPLSEHLHAFTNLEALQDKKDRSGRKRKRELERQKLQEMRQRQTGREAVRRIWQKRE